MKQNYLILFIFLANSLLITCLNLKLKQMFSELKDLQADGINIQDISKIKDIAGLDSMINKKGSTEKLNSQSSPSKSDVDSIRNQLLKETMGQDSSLDNKSININEKDIDKMIKDKEQQLEVNPNAILSNIDSLNKSKPSKDEETLTGMESCDEIKKYGKQKLYCEDKFLLKFVIIDNILGRRKDSKLHEEFLFYML